MSIGRFMAGVAGLIRSPDEEKYLLLQRSDEKDYAAGVWECVTGRVDQGEGFETALRREIYEEIGITDVEIEFIIGTTHFYRGPAEAENELLGVVYACAVDDAMAIQTSLEHSAYRWVTAREADRLLSATDPSTQWIRRVIERAEMFRNTLAAASSDRNFPDSFELD